MSCFSVKTLKNKLVIFQCKNIVKNLWSTFFGEKTLKYSIISTKNLQNLQNLQKIYKIYKIYKNLQKIYKIYKFTKFTVWYIGVYKIYKQFTVYRFCPLNWLLFVNIYKFMHLVDNIYKLSDCVVCMHIKIICIHFEKNVNICI